MSILSGACDEKQCVKGKQSPEAWTIKLRRLHGPKSMATMTLGWHKTCTNQQQRTTVWCKRNQGKNEADWPRAFDYSSPAESRNFASITNKCKSTTVTSSLCVLPAHVHPEPPSTEFDLWRSNLEVCTPWTPHQQDTKKGQGIIIQNTKRQCLHFNN